MKPIPILLAAGVALAFSGAARAQQTPPASLPPPPGIDDPGVASSAPLAPASSVGAMALPRLPSMRDEGPLDARGQPPPTVTVHHHDGDTIEEYSRNGHLIMVRVTPRRGVPYTYMVDAAGKLVGPPDAPPVKPVYYKIYEWGKPPPPVNTDSGGGDR